MKKTFNIQRSTFNIQRIILISVISLSAFQLSSCSTTKDASGNTTTTLTAGGDAAVAAAVQIATVAANAAIQTYLTAAPQVHGRMAALSRSNPAIAAAERATENEINNSTIALPKSRVHRITADAFAKAIKEKR